MAFVQTPILVNGEYREGELNNIREVSLKVKKIIVYRHELDELSGSMSAEIHLENIGSGGVDLVRDDCLGRKSNNEDK